MVEILDGPSNASFNAFNAIEHSVLDIVKFRDQTLVFVCWKS